MPVHAATGGVLPLPEKCNDTGNHKLHATTSPSRTPAIEAAKNAEAIARGNIFIVQGEAQTQGSNGFAVNARVSEQPQERARCCHCNKFFDKSEGYPHRGEFYCYDDVSMLAENGEFYCGD
jgi:hypothetical protein